MKRLILKVLRITGLSVAGILLLLFLTPILFPGTVAEKIKSWTNSSINGELNFSKARLSFFKHFPSLTLTLYNFTLKGSAPFKKDTLVAADEIALGINIKNLVFNNRININKIYISDAFMNVQVNEKGAANYNVYNSENKKTTSNTDTAGTALRLEKIIVDNSHLVYNDKSTDILLNARGFNYTGNGDLSKAIFDLSSHAAIDSLDFYFGPEAYLLNKKIDADLVTKINTNSLAFFFEKNNLLINRLPIQFNGKLDFLKNGYDLDFTVSSVKSELHDFITALPAQYNNWLQKTTVKGKTDFQLTLKGQYIASTGAMPNLAFDMKIRGGYLKYEGAPVPVSNLFLNLQTTMPSINTDSLLVKVDSVFFNIDKDFLSAVINTRGLQQPFVSGKIAAALDLEKLDQAFGIAGIDLKGKLALRGTVNGSYVTGPNPNSLRHNNIVVRIPSFSLQSTVKNGYLKYDSLPLAISNINFKLNSACADSNYQHSSFSIEAFSATALNNFIKGYARIGRLQDKTVDAGLQANIDLADIKKMYPVKEVDLAGLLKLNIVAKGQYNERKKTFPATTANISLQQGSVKTAYYPNPINNIQLSSSISDATGTLKDLQVLVEPASFQFEGKPFRLQASCKNFEDIAYAVTANGEIDIAKVYKVFSRKGLDITGFIKADLSLQGRQSDAVHGRYSQLKNSGTLQLKNIQASAESFPKPFLIKDGLFTFRQDKMWFNHFSAVYGQSDFSMDGYLQNVIDFAMSDKAVLKGNFNLQANYINADQFTAFAAPAPDSMTAGKKAVATTTGSTGVIMVPVNLDLVVTAAAKKIAYNDLSLENAKGHLTISHGKLTLKETGFNLVGCNVLMDADYANTGATKASFNYHLQAKDFDIKKAWNEIKIFHDMATSAGKAQGIVSLDYNLAGVLGQNMHPLYPSLQGAGTLSVKDIKLYGLKLFAAVGRQTGKDSVNNPRMTKVDIKTTIKNNVITIERFKFKVAGFRPRIEGQTSFDGRLNIKMRLGLPPLGIIGIPMRITGTQDNPKVKLGKGDKEDIPETEYKEQDR